METRDGQLFGSFAWYGITKTSLHLEHNFKMYIINPLEASVAFSILLWLTPDDFTLANARRFYSSMGDLLATRGLI